MDAIIRARGLNFQNIISYGLIEIERGKTTFICGESGCGKSTLLKLFNTTLSPDAGSVEYNGQAIDQIDTVSLRQEILLVAQSVFLFPGTIEENFNTYYQYREMQAPTLKMQEEYLTICDIQMDPKQQCETMSGGERQRIFTAICLSLLPKVLMLDEPTSALDEKTAKKVICNIKEYAVTHGTTLIIISHDKGLAEEFADAKITLRREAE